MFLNVTHHEVLDCAAAAAFQKLHLGDACGTDCGAAPSFINGAHLPRSLVVFIHVLLNWLLLSVKFSVSATKLRNSLMSSSHLLLGLPIALLVLYFKLNSGFHSAAFINHLSLGDVAILSASLFFLLLCLVPASDRLISHLCYGIVCASFLCCLPIFFLNLCCIDLFVIVTLE